DGSMTRPLRKTAVSVEHRAPHRPAAPHRADSAVITSQDRRQQLPKLALNNVCLSYGTNAHNRLIALNNINLKVQPGEFLCIVGPSGCGKSTLLHLIAGLHQQSSGDVLVDNKPVQGPG